MLKIKKYLPIICLLGILMLPIMSLAVEFDPYGAIGNVSLGQPEEDAVSTITVNILNIILGFLALAAVVVIIIAGFKYMFSGGDTETMKKAKNILLGAVIGLAVVLAAWAITTYVISELNQITTSSPEDYNTPQD